MLEDNLISIGNSALTDEVYTRPSYILHKVTVYEVQGFSDGKNVSVYS